MKKQSMAEMQREMMALALEEQRAKTERAQSKARQALLIEEGIRNEVRKNQLPDLPS